MLPVMSVSLSVFLHRGPKLSRLALFKRGPPPPVPLSCVCSNFFTFITSIGKRALAVDRKAFWFIIWSVQNEKKSRDVIPEISVHLFVHHLFTSELPSRQPVVPSPVNILPKWTDGGMDSVSG